MKSVLTIVSVQEAYDDLLRRSLAKLPCELARLIYLASMRDYNTAKYHHDGLSDRFSPEIAAQALALAHRDSFAKVAALPLQDLVKQMETYLQSSHEEYLDVLRAWWRLEPYRIAIPMNANPTVAAFFISNVKLALAILPRVLPAALPCPSAASPLR
jgi:hypothetical protein